MQTSTGTAPNRDPHLATCSRVDFDDGAKIWAPSGERHAAFRDPDETSWLKDPEPVDLPLYRAREDMTQGP